MAQVGRWRRVTTEWNQMSMDIYEKKKKRKRRRKVYVKLKYYEEKLHFWTTNSCQQLAWRWHDTSTWHYRVLRVLSLGRVPVPRWPNERKPSVHLFRRMRRTYKWKKNGRKRFFVRLVGMILSKKNGRWKSGDSRTMPPQSRCQTDNEDTQSVTVPDWLADCYCLMVYDDNADNKKNDNKNHNNNKFAVFFSLNVFLSLNWLRISCRCVVIWRSAYDCVLVKNYVHNSTRPKGIARTVKRKKNKCWLRYVHATLIILLSSNDSPGNHGFDARHTSSVPSWSDNTASVSMLIVLLPP